jgi:excinuclease ABC subunit A
MTIRIQGAREHNLQGVEVAFGDGLTAVTGVSGSGKTSLVFDTLYHEARRRFLEVYSLGSSATRLTPARVGEITGLGPAVAVGQNLLNRNPNSTLATASGLHPFLRLLYANFGERFCAKCGRGLLVLTEDEIVARLVSQGESGSFSVFAPLLQEVPGSHQTLLRLLAGTFEAEALWVDGEVWGGDQLDPGDPHSIEIKLADFDGTVSSTQAREVVQNAVSLGVGALTLRMGDRVSTLARTPVCVRCGTWFDELKPLHFHTPCTHCKGAGCERCQGTGLHPQAAGVRWSSLRFPELLAQSVTDVGALFRDLEVSTTAERLCDEVKRRLDALERVGLGYISLDRPSPTLSRGEAQRVRLAIILTSRLEDMLHVLDEPTIGLHPADVDTLLSAFRELAGPVIFVEHDHIAASQAHQVVDLGPGAGRNGGQVLFSGTPAQLWAMDTPTGKYFSLRERVHSPETRPEPEAFLTLRGADLRNLQDIDVPIPLGRLTVVTGVSGSGKSTLVEDVLVASLSKGKPIGCRNIEGPEIKPVLVDQSPIGRNPRSNPATYTKLSDVIRDLYAGETGLSPSHFSFNRPEGACQTCKGMGAVEVKMRYLPSTWIPCSDCEGRRFSDEVLSRRVQFGDRYFSIADFYQLPISEVVPLLLDDQRLSMRNQGAAKQILKALDDVGLGYLALGQPSPTLSGGEAQRVKLARYLGGRGLSKRLLVLDEPSTGLHPQDLAGLLVVLDQLVRAGATVVVVEHNTDIIRAADWIIDLGPGSGPEGGRLLFGGSPAGLAKVADSRTGQALDAEADLCPGKGDEEKGARREAVIAIRDARAHNLKGVDVDIPKGALTVVTGVSGSGKSSLVSDVLEAEARRRFLESLSLYERQSTREGPEAPVGEVRGLGVALTVTPDRQAYQYRATVGTATEIAHHLAVLLAALGERDCPTCGMAMIRGETWECPTCGEVAPLAKTRHFSPRTYAAACLTCHGVGSMQVPRPEKLIIHPEKPLCEGAMYSPGFFPKGYLCKPYNHGYYIVLAVGERYGFDPQTTPWKQMTPEAQHAFLYGDPEPLEVHAETRTRGPHTFRTKYPGFYGWVRDWDVGGTYTDTQTCPACQGARLRPEYLAVTLRGKNIHQMSEMTLAELAGVLDEVEGEVGTISGFPVSSNLEITRNRLRFLIQVGLGYLHLNRVSATLSAGEAQRVKLAGLLGSGLTSLTVLLDEPSRGMHPSEVEALIGALRVLRDEGNTVLVVEHDPVFLHAADHLVDLGPGAGVAGGEIVAQGPPEQVIRADTVTATWLRGDGKLEFPVKYKPPRAWMSLRGAQANNLRGEDVHLPLGLLVGLCGVSGSGKSTLLIDTLGRALAPKKHTTSVAYEPMEPGEHEAIVGAPERTILVDQTKAGVTSPLLFLDLSRPLRKLYTQSPDAIALGIDEKSFAGRCSACKGKGYTKLDMGFLPAVRVACETCRGTGCPPEVWDILLHGVALPELYAFTLDEVYELFGNEAGLTRPLEAAREVGLGYLVLRQAGYTLSGGEAQRLKIARELCRKTKTETLYILDEPSVGQHLEDVARLIGVLRRLVETGHSVIVSEHHTYILAACDWLVELGPGGGPDGGYVIASGTPPSLAGGKTPSAPYLREVLNLSH